MGRGGRLCILWAGRGGGHVLRAGTAGERRRRGGVYSHRLLIVNILVVNNLRDIPTDRASGKHTLAVRFGEAWTRREYLTLLILTYLVTTLASLTGILPLGGLLALASLPLAVQVTRGVWSNQGRALNRSLAGSAQLVLVFSLLFSLGVVLEKIVFR